MSQKCRHEPCNNPTTNPTGYCYAHEHLVPGVTPRGQYVQRRGNGPLSLPVRLAREERVPVPADSLGVTGFPYFSRSDALAYRSFLQGDERYRPPVDIILERFPVVAEDVDGLEITGTEIGVYDDDDDLHLFDQSVPVAERVVNMGAVGRVLTDTDGQAFAARSGRSYQVVKINDALIRDVIAALD